MELDPTQPSEKKTYFWLGESALFNGQLQGLTRFEIVEDGVVTGEELGSDAMPPGLSTDKLNKTKSDTYL